MKLAKSLLLGSATGLVAVASASAADLPVRKAAPVDYVRVCSAYGTGFFYIPGTDTCLRVGGSVRMDINTSELNQRGGLVTRGQNSYTTNGRARLFLDSRTGTDFGMLRAYIGVEHTIPGSNGGANATRIPQAYIQWGGLTAGRISSSAFEYYTSATYRGSYRSSSSTYYDGANALWYTFDFGQGFSATLALEDNNTRRVVNTDINSITYGGRRMPEFVANLRVSQDWGGAHLGLAAHQIYGNTAAVGDKWGYAAILGANVKLPMLAPGSEMWLQGSIGDGALDYTGVSGITTRRIGFSAANAYVDGANSIRTTKSWTISGGLRHNWTPTIQSNFHGAFGRVDVPAFARPVATLGAATATNNSFSWYSLEKNIIWRPVSGLQLGAEVQYDNVTGKVRHTAASGATVKTDGIWSGRLRIQRDF